LKKTLLYVEDDVIALRTVYTLLTGNGYTVFTAKNLSEARIHINNNILDALILDIILPDGLGTELLKELRTSGNQIPVLLLTACEEPSDVRDGLDAGANDYLVKSPGYEVLLSRINAMFRNIEHIPERITKGNLVLNTLCSQVLVNGKDILLTQKEFALLMLLMSNENKKLNTKYLYERIWNQPMNENSQALRMTLSRLRMKLEYSDYTIVALRGSGYIFKKQVDECKQ
jgi:DNA-binding response OmpR family regulator